MSGPPDDSIFSKMTSRGAGKRQIKPTAVLYASLENGHDSDDDDDDFEVKMKQDGESTATESGSESSSNSGSDEDEEEDEEENESEGNQNGDVLEAEGCSMSTPICGVCINRKKIDDSFEFMQCDSCGIQVHECCYGGVMLDENEEESKSTTNWFCEPCMYGLKEPPYCEFCPNRYGAFKRTDVGGRWVHLTCALFTPEVTFSAVEILSGISWQEVGNSILGKRTCGLCEDRIDSHVGVATRCESGLCKTSLHATCAQKLGLLIDETDNHDENDDRDENAISLMRYFFCKRHSHLDDSSKLKKIYSLWEKQECKRITMNRRKKPLSEEEERNRNVMMDKLEHTFANLKDITINIPTEAIEKTRRARLLNSSSEFIDRFETKAIVYGATAKEFRAPFYDIKSTNTSYVPVGFSKEYIDYMNLRDNTLIPEEEEKLTLIRATVKLTKEKQHKLSHSKEIVEKLSKNQAEIDKKRTMISDFCAVLIKIGEKKHEFAGIVKELQENVGNGVVKKQDVSNGTTTKSRGKMVDRKKAKKEEEVKVPVLKKCEECDNISDQHKMTDCDECHKSYHIGCLNPPLLRVPKRTATCGWMCHRCNESSESEEEPTLDSPEGASDTNTGRATRSRRPPVRHSSFFEH